MSIFSTARRFAKALVTRPQSTYEQRFANELEQFRHCENVHDLPEIFHYWSNKYVVPMLKPFGFSNPDDFFFTYFKRVVENDPGGIARIASVGSGNSELEVKLAEKLQELGYSNFQIECLDINTAMHERGRLLAQQKKVEEHIVFIETDFNFWKPADKTYSAIMANQSLHHVKELEHLFGATSRGLKEGGKFLISDMIGRNGHQRWPEAIELINQFWKELPDSYRFNRQMNRLEQQYINHDCSTSGFEGIRAQDILPLLVKNFHFEFFLPYGNIIFPFIDRSFGHNFDAESEWDLDFIDRVHFADEAGMLSGQLKPTSMLAVVCNEKASTSVRDPRLSPETCIRWPDSK